MRAGHFHVRRRWPATLVAMGGVRAPRVSLRTHLLAVAMRRANALAAAMERAGNSVMSVSVARLSEPHEARAIVAETIRSAIAAMTGEEAEASPRDADEADDALARIEARLDALRAALRPRDVAPAAAPARAAGAARGIEPSAAHGRGAAQAAMGALIAVAEAECAVERGATVEEATRAIREQRFCGRPADAPPRPVMLSAAIAHAVDRATSDDVARKIRGTGALMLTHDGDRPADLVFGRDARIARLRWMARSPRDRGKAHGRDARETALLSPHRARPRPAEARDRRIVTDAQDVIWATDATQVAAVRDGKVWVFAVAGRRNAEALGWHGSTRGARRQALQAMRMTVRRQSGHPGRDAARGLARRHDHGSAFMAGDFPNRIRAWGAPPGHAVVGQPQTDGVIERFFRTCAEQVARGRIVQTIDEVRDAIRDVVACCDAEWLIEKNGHQSPDAMREKWNRETMPRVA